MPGRRYTGGDADHVRLGDTRVVEALRVGGLELAGLGGGGEVGVQDHEVVVLGAEGHELLSVACAGGDLLDISHVYSSFPAASSSAMACSYCSSLGALPCQPT